MFQKLALTLLVFIAVSSIHADDFKKLVKNYNSINTSGKADIREADLLLADMNTDGSFKSVKYNDKSRGLWKGMKHWHNLRSIVAAWNQTQNVKYSQAVNNGLRFWGKNLPSNANWWWQEIGVPFQMIRVINNMNGAVSKDTLETLRPVFKRARLHGTGQNLADAAIIHLWKGVIYGDEKTVREAIDCFKTVITVAAPGKQGVQADFSFHQHGPQQQFGNYGMGFLRNCSTFLPLLTGTSFSLSPNEIDIIWNYYNATVWTLYKKQMDILACGRQIIKNAPSGKYKQIQTNGYILGKALNKKDDVDKFFNADAALEGSRYFYRSDYLIHRRNDFYFSYKMCSSRVIGSETINKENLQGLYLGCGVMQYKVSGSEYDNMPALWDWRRLPGLTAVYDNDSLNARGGRKKQNVSSTVGAVSDNKNTGIIMGSSSSKLDFSKSIAAIDRTVVFNLNNILNKTKYPVNTTIDSRLYRTPVKVTSADGTKVFENGTHKIAKVSRITHDNVAYTFLIPQNLILAIEEKSVPWNTITIDAKNIEKGKTFTIYIDHTAAKRGKENVSYAISPATEKVDIKTFFNKSGHVIKDENSRNCFAFFFAPGEMDIPGIGKLSCDKKAAVMLTGNNILAADAQQKNKTLNLTLNGKKYSFTLLQDGFAGKTAILSK